MTKLKSVWHAQNRIEFIKSLKAQIATLTDDDQAIRDTLEGELEAGEVDGIMNTLLYERAVAEEIAAARRAYAARLTDSASVSEAYADKIRDMIGEALRAAGRDEWKGVLGSCSFGAGALKVEVTNPGLIPLDPYYRPVLDKAKVNEDAKALQKAIWEIEADVTLTADERAAKLAAVKQIDGVRVYRGDPVLTIRKPRGKKGEQADVE